MFGIRRAGGGAKHVNETSVPIRCGRPSWLTKQLLDSEEIVSRLQKTASRREHSSFPWDHTEYLKSIPLVVGGHGTVSKIQLNLAQS